MSEARYVCICADDFGMSEGINEAVFELVERSKISAVGCMVRREFWQAGARTLAQVDARHVDLGLHLDLNFPETFGKPESPLWRLILAAYIGFLPARRIRDEIKLQLDRFEDTMSRPPAFIDGHCHVHQLPGVREALMAELNSRYRAEPPWLRSTAPAHAHSVPRSKADVIHAIGGKALLRKARRHHLPVSRRLLGVYDFDSPVDYGAALAQWLRISQTGDVLMCHPSAGDSPAAPHGAARRREFLALRNTAWPDAPGGPSLAPLSRHVRHGAARSIG